MHLTTLVASALSVASVILALEKRDDVPLQSDGTDIGAKRFILEFAAGVDVQAAAQALSIRSGTKVIKVFDGDVFAGASVEAPNDNADSLNALTTVSRVWNSKKIRLPSHNITQKFTDGVSSPIGVGSPEYNIHQFTGVQQLHDAGLLGKGAKVGIVDTGTYYYHSALGGGFGPGYKVAGGWDFAGNGDWPLSGEKEPDADPLDQLGHGTHVAGIVAGKNEKFTGVAPEATIYSYKVFGDVDATDEDTLIEAFLAADKDGVDIITSSVGGLSGWASDAWAVVASRLVEEKGILITIAAGNDGYAGFFAPSSGSSGDNVLAVASVDPGELAAPVALVTFTTPDGQSSTSKVGYLPATYLVPQGDVGFPLYIPKADTCQPLPEDTPDLSGYVVLLDTLECSTAIKHQHVLEYNASIVWFINTEYDEIIPPTFYTPFSYLGLIAHDVGTSILNFLNTGGNVTADFSLDGNENWVGIPNPAGGKSSYFTSNGGLFDLKLKPDIAAPGAQIMSTYIDGGYVVMSGTSMATPYVAGVAALYVGQYGGRSVHGPSFGKTLASRIAASGKAVPWKDISSNKDYGFWAPSVQVGAGLVNATKVLDLTTELSFTKFALNDTHHFSRYQSVNITNTGNTDVTYTFSVQDAGGFESWQARGDAVSPHFKTYDELSPIQIAVQVKFPSGTFTVKSGQTKTATFTFEPPTGLSTNVPVYSGRILITGDNGEELVVPYFGVGTDLKAALDTQFYDNYPWVFTGNGQNGWPTIDQKPYVDFNLSLEAQSFLQIHSRIQWGTPELRWDIFDADWKERDWSYPPVPGQKGFLGTATSYAAADSYTVFDPSSLDASDVYSFPLYDLPRTLSYSSDEQYWWLGQFGNGSHVTPGNYTLRFAVLKPFGEPTHSDNWETSTHAFTVLPLV